MRFKVRQMWPAPAACSAVFKDAETGQVLKLPVLYFAQLSADDDPGDEMVVPMVYNSLGFDADCLVPAGDVKGFIGLGLGDDLRQWEDKFGAPRRAPPVPSSRL